MVESVNTVLKLADLCKTSQRIIHYYGKLQHLLPNLQIFCISPSIIFWRMIDYSLQSEF